MAIGHRGGVVGGTMQRIFAVLLCMLALTVHAAAELVSPESFTEQFRAALSEALPDYSIEVVEPLQLKITGPQGAGGSAYLDNAYNSYSLQPADKAAVIARYVASFMEAAQQAAPLNPEQIVPVIKDRIWLKQLQRDMKSRGATPMQAQVIEELNKDLVIVYAEDSPQNIRFISNQALQDAGLQKEKLRELAVANLRRILPPVDAVNGPLVSMLTAGEYYSASLLLMEDVWNNEKLGVSGEIVVAVPTRDVLLFTDSRNKDGVKKLRELAKQAAADGPYSLSDRLFVYRGGRFERF
jgi:uncharacterized protein YtpQ (UPF0354 family)